MNSEKQIIVTDCMCCSARIGLYHSEANDIIFSFVASQFFSFVYLYFSCWIHVSALLIMLLTQMQFSLIHFSKQKSFSQFLDIEGGRGTSRHWASDSKSQTPALLLNILTEEAICSQAWKALNALRLDPEPRNPPNQAPMLEVYIST